MKHHGGMLLCGMICGFLMGGCPAGSDAPAVGYYYYYGKEKVSLNLDTSQLAILGQSGSGQVPVAAVEAMGVAADEVTSSRFEGWWTVPVPTAKRQSQGIEQMAQLAAADASAFVTPVFIDENGYPILITPDILVEFNEDVDAGAIARILDEEGIGGTAENEGAAGMKGFYVLRTDFPTGFAVLEAANHLAERPEVQSAEPNVECVAIEL